MEDKDKKRNLDKLKEDYEALRIKHGLPSFHDLNKDFWIDELAEAETDILIRKIRAKIGDSLSRLARFIEGILNPVNASMFVFQFIKVISPEDKKIFSEIYKELMKREIINIELDLDFNEDNEAKFIKEVHIFWQTAKKDMLKIMKKVNMNWDTKTEEGKRDYFG
jgi:hypothetical protein